MAVTVNRARDINILKMYLEGMSTEDIAKHYRLKSKYHIQEILEKQPKILRRYMFEHCVDTNNAKTLEQVVASKQYWLDLIQQMKLQST